MEFVQIFLTTPSLEEARPFYEDGLGLGPARVGETSIEYEVEGAILKVQEDFEDDTFEDFGIRAPPEAPKRGDGAVFVLRVENIEETLEKVKSGVGEVTQGPRSVPWGDRIALVRSPAGYIFELRD